MIQIDVYADVVCPWCYIGEHRLEQALVQRSDLEVEWRWRPFQLQPNIPKAGLPWEVFAKAKFGGVERAQAVFQHVASVGASEGLTLAFDKVASAPNTADAHRLILFAQERGLQRDAARALFDAYFAQGFDLNDTNALVRVAERAGLEEEAVRDYLNSEAGADAVRRSQEDAEALGISGVLFFVFEGRYRLSGAQPVDVFLSALEKVSPVGA